MILSSYFIQFLCILTKVENTLGIRPHILKKIKMFFLRHMITNDAHFTNNEISNIVCIKANRTGKFHRSLEKITDKPLSDIFRVSPRAIVSCVLNNNITMLMYLQNTGYPLEMMFYATNFGLVQKRKKTHILQELALAINDNGN